MFNYLKLKGKIIEQEAVIKNYQRTYSKMKDEIENLKKEIEDEESQRREATYTENYAVNLLKIDVVEIKKKGKEHALIFSSSSKEVLFCWLGDGKLSEITEAYKKAVENMGKPVILLMENRGFKFLKDGKYE